jgi:apolipoprotein N-acyltransferase
VVYQDSVGKRRLVPISEAQYRPQERWRPLEVPEARLGVMICYESLYPDITAAMPEAELWLVAANDAGLRWSQAPRIHARLGILRAIETGRGLIHASQAGYSFLVDPYGRRTAELGLFERGVVLGGVTTAHVPTLYQVLGRAWVLLAASVWALSLFLSRRMTTKSDR